jgi:uncharacterized membrane protein YfcA
MHFTPEQWLYGAFAALLVGFSKTGMPGVGILVVPLLAKAFGGTPSVGIMLPMLLFGDVFAVTWYKRHARWDKLWELAPSVVAGMAAGTALLWLTGAKSGHRDPMNQIIGALVLLMLAVHVARLRWGDRLTPHSRIGVVTTGGAAGFTTTASNAAGPIMNIYLQAMAMPKEQFMGTTAWFFFLVNLTKLPIFYTLSVAHPGKAMITATSLLFDLLMFPVILAGVFVGKWFLPRISQRAFDGLVLVLAGFAALKLVVG